MEIQDKRRHAIADSIATMAAGLISENIIRDVETDAAESDSGESDKPVMAKLALSFQWPAGAAVAEIEAKLAWSVRRVQTADCVCDPSQMVMGFGDEGGSE
jgi:hypothetical protein